MNIGSLGAGRAATTIQSVVRGRQARERAAAQAASGALTAVPPSFQF